MCLERMAGNHCVSVRSHRSHAVFHHLTVRPVSLTTLILGKIIRFMSRNEIQFGIRV